MRARLGVVALYLLAAAAITWPLAANLTTRLGAPQGPGDPYLNLWALGWGMHAWITDPAGVLSGRAFDANIFHPAAGTLTYSDHQLLQALVVAPVYGITGDAVLGYNLVLLLSIAGSGLAMFAGARAVTGSTPGAIVAGLAWACWPYRTAHLIHIQLQALFFLPIALLLLHKVAAGRRTSHAVLLALAAAGQAIVSVYYGVMTALALVVSAVAVAVASGQWRSRRFWTRMALAALVGAVVVAPVLVPYLRSQQQEGFGRNLFEAANHAATFQSYTQVPPSNLLYGATGVLAPRAPAAGERDRRGVEHQMFPGVMLLVLAAVGAWRGWRGDARPLVATCVVLTAAGVTLSFGPDGARWLYATLHDVVFGFQAIRAPARFAVLAVAGLCMLAALALRDLPQKRRVVVGGLCAALLMLEYVNVPLVLADAPPRTTAVGQWLRNEPTPGPVLYLPLADDTGNTPFMVQSLEHFRPIVNGYSGQRPPFFSAILEALSELPSSEAFATIKELDVRFIVSPEPIAGVEDPRLPLVERARLDGGIIYEVRWTEVSEAALADAMPPRPALPDSVPFDIGEAATYDVMWEGGPLDLAAGTVTLKVADYATLPGGDHPAARWGFEVTARTAEWVSRFFEANDRFATVTDMGLAPVMHTRQLREGSRSVDQTYIYAFNEGLVRIGRDEDEARDPAALALPLAPGSLDAVSALFYVRSIELAPGERVTLPLNEGGRSMGLEIAVAELETIDVGGARVEALRIEPRIVRRVERRQPLRMRVWLSTDERRIPLVFAVEAGFGRVRANLVDYRR